MRPQTNKFAVWWDGDLLREQLEHSSIYKWNWKEQRSDLLLKAEGTTIQGAPMLSADILGDWREEVVLPAIDQQSLRIYTTPHVTSHKFVTLMQDPQYRLAVAWQNVAYNQPPHPSFDLGTAEAALLQTMGQTRLSDLAQQIVLPSAKPAPAPRRRKKAG